MSDLGSQSQMAESEQAFAPPVPNNGRQLSVEDILEECVILSKLRVLIIHERLARRMYAHEVSNVSVSYP